LLERDAQAELGSSLYYFRLGETGSLEREWHMTSLFTHANTRKQCQYHNSDITKQSITKSNSHGHVLNLIGPPKLEIEPQTTI